MHVSKAILEAEALGSPHGDRIPIMLLHTGSCDSASAIETLIRGCIPCVLWTDALFVGHS